MVAGLRADATAVINHDDPFAALWKSMTPARIVTFGLEPGADFSAGSSHTTIDATGFLTRFTLHAPQGSVPVELHLAGRHNLVNALGAAAAASAAGLGLPEIARGLAAARPVPGRLQFKRAASGAWIIDDSYNANPSSMRAGIEVLAELEGTKWLVIGDMAELGEYAPAAHTEIGEFARAHGVERLFAMGGLAKLAVDSFGAGAEWFSDASALASALVKALADAGGSTAGTSTTAAGVRLLIKGSRVNRLERVVDTLVHGSTKPTSDH
jgi:UDP-N-acetylmuramoyl-tripeptide--D-alanyl-D-alanine ligase